MGSKRTIITLSEEDKMWLEGYSKAFNISVAEVIRRGIKQLRESHESGPYQKLVENTRGIWKKSVESKMKRTEIQDPVGRIFYPFHPGRDGCRTPMQWSSKEGAGFTGSTPWLRTDSSYSVVNVDSQHKDPESLLSWYRNLIWMRKKKQSLLKGDLQILPLKERNVLCFIRNHESELSLVTLNFKNKAVKLTLQKSFGKKTWKLVLSSNQNQNSTFNEILSLSPLEAALWDG